MKIRKSFVSNSSSCSFIITNLTNTKKSLYDFAVENLYIVDEYLEKYNWKRDDPYELKHKILSDAIHENESFAPGESKIMVFGDEDDTNIGRVYDYMLRDGGYSDSFKWELNEMLR